MSAIPTQLFIRINTSVAGHQTIYYKPSMTDPKKYEHTKNVYFNPFVKLNSDVINKVPSNLKVKQFFDNGYYQSLIQSHGNQKKINIKEAEKEGIIDNNIHTTLDVLFPTKGLFYIKNKPYTIIDVQWTSGEWRIGKSMYGTNYVPSTTSKYKPAITPTSSHPSGGTKRKKTVKKRNKTQKAINRKSQKGGKHKKSKHKKDDLLFLPNVCYINIYMELQKGDHISSEDMKNVKCRQQWNSIRKSYAIYKGEEYVVAPVYSNSPDENPNNEKPKQ